MAKEIVFEELGIKERTLLLRAFDFDVDNEGFILSPSGNRIKSEEYPGKFLKVEEAALTPGSLNVTDGSLTSISKFIRERLETSDRNPE